MPIILFRVVANFITGMSLIKTAFVRWEELRIPCCFKNGKVVVILAA